ncbi:MAG: DUF167 domain-containing protein [Candidatus Omnitrophica bacterium]|nr:DUF167 domain-containing protein [Candidatus Omnitrophota bacterium]
MNVQVKVVANAAKNMVKSEGDYLKVYVGAQREKGKANKEVVRVLAEHFKISKSDIEIVSGETTNKKTVHFKVPVKI